MKKLLTARNLAVVSSVLFSAVLLFLIFGQSAPPGGRSDRGSAGPASADSAKPMPAQAMPDGTQRALTLRIPAVGRVAGTRWIPGQLFQKVNPQRDSRSPLSNLPLDVIVDAEGHFIAARRGGTRFDSRMADISMIRLLQYSIYEEYNRRQQRITGPVLPAISRVSLAKIPWDDPQLGETLKWLMNMGYLRSSGDPLDATLQRFEDTYFFFEVQFEGEPTPRHISVRRYSEGKVWKAASGGPMTFPPLPEPYISGTNINGAGVIYLVLDHPKEGQQWAEPTYLYLTEPWDGPCPWPLDRLDPAVGHDQINEFFFPDEAPVERMTDILNLRNPTYPNSADKPYMDRARRNKEERLAKEAASKGTQ